MLLLAPRLAKIDPWTILPDDEGHRLFGYLLSHPTLGGKSWAISTPIVRRTARRAVTESGRHYALGRHILLSQLPTDEAHIALRCLRDRLLGLASDAASEQFLSVCKMARWLGLPIPDRHDPAAVTQFMATQTAAYLALRKIPQPEPGED